MILEATNCRSCSKNIIDCLTCAHSIYLHNIYKFNILFIFNLFQYIKYNTRHCLMWNPYHNSRCYRCQCCLISTRLQDLCFSKVSNTAFCLGTSDFGCLFCCLHQMRLGKIFVQDTMTGMDTDSTISWLSRAGREALVKNPPLMMEFSTSV